MMEEGREEEKDKGLNSPHPQTSKADIHEVHQRWATTRQLLEAALRALFMTPLLYAFGSDDSTTASLPPWGDRGIN